MKRSHRDARDLPFRNRCGVEERLAPRSSRRHVWSKVQSSKCRISRQLRYEGPLPTEGVATFLTSGTGRSPLPIPTPHMRPLLRLPGFPSAVGIAVGALACVYFVMAPAGVNAQATFELPVVSAVESPPDTRQGSNPAEGRRSSGSQLHWHLTALVGSRGLGNDSHPFAGLEATLLRGRFGAAATGQMGSGNDYRSTLLAAGPALHIIDLGPVALSGWAGLARYKEELDVGPSREVTGALLTLAARRPVLLGSVSLQVGWLVARLDEPDFQQAIPVNSIRIAVGIGR